VDGDSIKRISGNFVEAYLKYEKANTLSTSFSGPYLSSCGDGRLHPGFNICGTVSYRLSGFKPYLLNAPFDEKAILKNLKCDEGYVGVHADLSAIEPTVTAHYSEDPSLLKVFRDGLGDIYLDLALELFKTDKELHYGYNPNIPITAEVKERFSKQRKVAKVIQLAVQYTGTKHTVSKNLTKEGIPTTIEQADEYVKAYWRKFGAVRTFNYQLREVNRKQGYLRNVTGRIIRVPDPEYKDLPNRFVQSSAHDILVLWVLSIYRRCEEEGIKIKPILLDCHDSTSNQVPKEQAERLRQIYGATLNVLNKELGLCVNIKAESKFFTTLAGLKNEE
jgi:DNA polymerase-1